MSYILDALRRADAERERGGVPGLHTQPAPTESDDDAGTRTRGLRPWHWVVIGLAGGLAVAVALQWPSSEAPAIQAPPPPPPMSPPTSPPIVPPITAAPPPAPLPATVAPPPTAPPATPVEIAPMRAMPKPAPATASAAAPAPIAAATAPTRVASLAELPADARRSLPPLAFGGSIYSNTPANRLLIVNGQLMHEGDSLGPGVTLEQIKPKAAVLTIGGQRYEIGL
jgi:general secretion pathway protein B